MCRTGKQIYSIKKVGYLLVVLLVVPSFFYGFSNEKNRAGKLQTVVIDAGHGGKDPGAVYGKLYEKNIALKIALKLGNYIKKNIPGVKVIYTRSKDVFIPLKNRAQIANKADADLFISIHIDALGTSTVYGTSTYVLGIHRNKDNLEVAKRENAAILLEDNYSSEYEGFNPKQAESYVIFELYQNQFLDHSLEFARFTQDQFRTRAGRRDRGVHQSGFLVLRETAMPSVLVECGYITNAKERRFLSTDNGQSYIASAIFRAFRSYKQRVDSRSNFQIVESDKPVAKVVDLTTELIVGKTKGIVFCTQIGASRKKLECLPQNFKGLRDVQKISQGKLYKYLTGVTSDYQQAVSQRKLVLSKYPDAFIIAFENGKQVSLVKARKNSKVAAIK